MNVESGPIVLNRKYCFSTEQIELIRKLASEEKTSTEIAQILNKTKKSICYIASKFKIKIRRPDGIKKKELDDIVKLYDAGMIIDDIANTINKSCKTVDLYVQYFKKIGRIQSSRRRSILAIDDQSVSNYLDEGKDLYQIANLLNRHPSVITKICKRINKFTRISNLIREQIKLQEEGLRKCRKCDMIKSLNSNNFYSRKQSFCIDCCRVEIKNRDKTERGKVFTLEKFIKYKLKNSLKVAKSPKYNYSFNLTYDYILNLYRNQNGKCFYTGRVMTFTRGCNDSLSIDRIDSVLGYTVDNVVLCCSKVNVMKSDLNHLDFIKICSEISALHKTNEC